MNVNSLNSDIITAQQQLENKNSRIFNTLIRISASEKISQAKNDAVEALLGTTSSTDARFLERAYMNVRDSASLLDTASSAVEQTSELFMQAEELAIRANSDALGAEERALLDDQYQSIMSTIDDLVSDTSFNGQAVFGNSFSFFLGTSSSDIVDVTFDDLSTASLGLTGTDLTSTSNAASALSAVQDGLNTVIGQQSSIANTGSILSSRADQLSEAMFNTHTSMIRIDSPDSLSSSVDLAKSLISQNATIASVVHNQSNLSAFLTDLS